MEETPPPRRAKARRHQPHRAGSRRHRRRPRLLRRLLDFEIARRSDTAAFVYFGDQFINFAKGRRQGPDERRHFGIAVDDKELARQRLEELGVTFLDGRFMDFLDPWGNRVEITTYTKIQYTKPDHILRGMGLAHLHKTDEALAELRAKGMGPEL